MDPQASVLARALQADPDAVGDRHPLGVGRAALEAFLEFKSSASEKEELLEHL